MLLSNSALNLMGLPPEIANAQCPITWAQRESCSLYILPGLTIKLGVGGSEDARWCCLGGKSVENQCCRALPAAGLTWGLRGAGLQVTGLFAHWLHQRVAAPDDVLPLVALHVPHPHTDAAGFCALGNRERG